MAEVCPKCGSENTRIENAAGFITGTRGNSICNDCNFSSMIFPHMNKSDLRSFKKTVKSNPVIPKN